MKKRTIITLLAIILFLLLLGVFMFPEKQKEFKTTHFTFYVSPGIDTLQIEKLSTALEQSYDQIAHDLQTEPSPQIETHIYAQRWRYVKATGNWGASGSIEGVSKLHFVEQAWGEKEIQKVAVHEFAHTVTLKLLWELEQPPLAPEAFDQKFATFPVWLWEGLSVYEAQQFIDPNTLPYFADGRYPSISELNDRAKGGKIYSCGYTLVEFIITTFGQPKLLELIQNYGDIPRTFKRSEEELAADWHRFLIKKYGIAS